MNFLFQQAYFNLLICIFKEEYFWGWGTFYRKYLLLVILFIFLFTITGCFGNNQEAAETAGPEDAGEDSANQLIVASDTDFPPFCFENPTTGEYTGFEIELLEEIEKINGWDCEIKSMNFQEVVPSLEDSSADLAISAITITGELQEKVDFSKPYFRSVQGIAVNSKDEVIRDLGDLEGRKIGVQAGTTGAKKARQISGAQMEVVEYTGVNEAIEALKNGEIHALVNDFPVLAYQIKEGDDDIKILESFETSEYYGIAVPENEKERLEEINQALKTLKENGKYLKIYKKWFGESPPEYLPGNPSQVD